MKKILSLVVCAVILEMGVQAQIPTIDVSSLQQLYAQFKVMEKQLSTSTDILGESKKILQQESDIYNNALGDITKVKDKFQSIMDGFKKLTPFDAFKGILSLPNIDFGRNIDKWVNPWFKGYGNLILSDGSPNIAAAEKLWTDSLDKLARGKATSWEQDLALAGYNSKLMQNAQESKTYGSNVVEQSKAAIDQVQDGTLIEQAGAQNALIYQQTSLLEKMKSDINDATIAEAAERERQIRKQQAEQTIQRAISNIPRE